MNSKFQHRLIDNWQRDFPMTSKPYDVLARKIETGEEQVLANLQKLQLEGVLTRVGAVVRPNTVGVSTLAAMKVPSGDLQAVADIVNSEPGVNHNYEREHDYNLWFVATNSDKASLEEALGRIAERAGIDVISLPLKKAHHIDLGFSMNKDHSTAHDRCTAVLPPPTIDICEADRQLLAAIEDGLPLVSQPYAQIATQLGVSEKDVLARLRRLVDGLVISRFGLVVRHRKMGYTSNAMAVWDIDDARVDAFGDLLAAKPFVTLCYQRRRVQPDWPYNLFCMIHGNDRASVLAQIDELNELVASQGVDGDQGYRGHTVLFSKKCFKQRGARFPSPSARSAGAERPVELSHAG